MKEFSSIILYTLCFYIFYFKIIDLLESKYFINFHHIMCYFQEIELKKLIVIKKECLNKTSVKNISNKL